MNIVIFAYRPDHTDVCRGCVMGSTESDMEYGVFDNVAEASDFLAKYWTFNQTRDQYEYARYEYTYIIDGMDMEDIGPDDHATMRIYTDLIDLAHEKLEVLESLYNEEKERKQAKKIADEKERIRLAELATLARLQEKHNK